ncbi:MAG TPA: hypothetical protein VFU22_14310 [Roseiflexaceae bacterium]|nr:hypothetical protein [Roseiflexaceae bacterium]
MSDVPAPHSHSSIPCCPDLNTDPVCDVLDQRNRLTFPTRVRTRTGQPVQVEVVIHTRFTRCSGPLAQGDLVYSTTLLPGEKVRLATTDRRSRFSLDSSTNLSYRDEQISEDQYRMTALRAFMFDQSATDQGQVRDTSKGSWDFHGDASGSIGFFSASADSNARGSHNAESTHDWIAEHRAHAESSDHQSVEATRKAHSLSIGEVATRAHAEGETHDHFESSSREFSNLNRCHAVTYLFYRINKLETISFSIVSIELRVIDPIAPTRGFFKPVEARGQVAVIPQSVSAISKERLAVEAIGRQSVLENAQSPRLAQVNSAVFARFPVDVADVPLTSADRQKALDEVRAELARVGLLDRETGLISPAAQERFGYSRTTSLPTPGIIVKGCLDECDVCEPELHRAIELELERKALENKLLARQIELLERSQEYRCCPAGSTEDA